MRKTRGLFVWAAVAAFVLALGVVSLSGCSSSGDAGAPAEEQQTTDDAQDQGQDGIDRKR